MKRISLLIFVLLAFLIFAGWAQSPPPVPEPAQGTVLPGGVLPWWPELNSWSIRNLQRTVVGGDMVHYSFDVLLGPGKFDMMTVHRVVREHSRRPYQPLRTADGVFLVPGAPQRFDTIFMPPTVSNVPARDRSFAVFLAKNDIDVWGLTFGWNFVPLETTDFSFMKGWGIEMDGRHTAIALSIARGIRESSGQGTGTLHLLGFSYGVYIAYAVAGAETQLP